LFIKTQIETKLDAEIQAALKELPNHAKTSEEYASIVKHISELHKLKIEEVEQTAKLKKQEQELADERRFGFSKQISPDTVLVVAANIFGILWLARYEREHVIRSRSALGFVMKPRS